MAVESRTEQTRDPSCDGSLVCFSLFVCLFGQSLAGCSADRLPTSRLFCPVFKLFSRSLAGRSTGCSPAARRFCLSGLLRRVRRVHWSVGSIGAGGGPLMPAPCRGLRPLPASRRRKSVPPPGSAPDEECTRPEPPARMPTTEPLRAQNLLARTCPAWDISARNISAQNVPVRAISPLGRPAPDTFTQEAPLRPSLPGRSRTPPLRRETPRDGS